MRAWLRNGTPCSCDDLRSSSITILYILERHTFPLGRALKQAQLQTLSHLSTQQERRQTRQARREDRIDIGEAMTTNHSLHDPSSSTRSRSSHCTKTVAAHCTLSAQTAPQASTCRRTSIPAEPNFARQNSLHLNNFVFSLAEPPYPVPYPLSPPTPRCPCPLDY